MGLGDKDNIRANHTEQALIRSETLYRTLFEGIINPITLMDRDGVVIIINKAGAKNLGLTPDECVGKSIFDLVPNIDDTFHEIYRQVIDTRVEVTKEEFVEIPSGPRWFWSIHQQVQDENSGRYALLVISYDITERKRAEEALLTMAEMLDTAPISITVRDFEGRVLYTNRKAFELHGYDEGEFMALKLSELDFPESAALIAERMAAIVKHGEATFPVRHFRKDGTTFPLEVYAKQVVWRGIPAMLSVATDITDRKQAEEEKAALQEQLQQSQKMEAIGILSGGVAHDFNNLLTVILSCAEALEACVREDDPKMKDIRDIREAGKRGATLTRQLLAFSSRQTIQPQIMDLNILITDLERMLHRLIGEDIEMRFTPDTDLWKVEADPGQIEQIIVNITVNARDAMPNGGKLIVETANVELDEEYVSYRSKVTPGEYVMIAITDTGCGMDTETMKNVFEPFFTTKGTGKGTGLGLSVAYGIVKQHKGNIWVYSELDKGTTFKIYLPRCTKKSGQEYRSGAPVESANLRGNETILVVDDDGTVLRAVARMLKQYGYNTLQATSGAQAKVVADEHEGPIHLLLTDVVMPGLSGRETAESVLVGRPEMGLLFMSGYTGNAIAHHGVLDSEVNFISKPFSNDDLARKVRLVIDENQEERQSSSD